MRYPACLLVWFITVISGPFAVPICLATGLPLGPWGNTEDGIDGDPHYKAFTAKLPSWLRWPRSYYWLVIRNPAHNVGKWLGVVQSQVDIKWFGDFPNDYFGKTGISSCVGTLGSAVYWQRYALIPLIGKWCLEWRMGWKFRPDAPGGYVAGLVFRPIALRRLDG